MTNKTMDVNNFFNQFLLNTYDVNLNLTQLENFYVFSNYEKHYTESFSIEYAIQPTIQLDSFNKLNINENRLYKNSEWEAKDLKGKSVLEIGSGAGKFTEILIKSECNLFSTDSSDAIQINYKNNFNKLINNKTYFIKADAKDLIFRNSVFNYILIYGVLQNVKNQKEILKNSYKLLKPGGKFSFDVTKKNKFFLHLLNPKYFWRFIFKKMNRSSLYSLVQFLVKKYYPLDTFLKKKFGKMGRIISKILFPFPLINYYFLDLDEETKINMTILDTYDCLASEYDQALTLSEVKILLKEIESEDNIYFNNLKIIEVNGLIVVNFLK